MATTKGRSKLVDVTTPAALETAINAVVEAEEASGFVLQGQSLENVINATTKEQDMKVLLTFVKDTYLPGVAHAASHQNAGTDEISVAGLSGLLADGQTPLAHKTSHQLAGADAINVGGLSGLLADGQTPLAHKTSHQLAGADAINVGGLSGKLADAQDPVAHASSHATGGADPLPAIATGQEVISPLEASPIGGTWTPALAANCPIVTKTSAAETVQLIYDVGRALRARTTANRGTMVTGFKYKYSQTAVPGADQVTLNVWKITQGVNTLAPAAVELAGTYDLDHDTNGERIAQVADQLIEYALTVPEYIPAGTGLIFVVTIVDAGAMVFIDKGLEVNFTYLDH